MTTTSIGSSNLTSGFIDLATYDEIEKYLYGGPNATAYFVRQTRKATWFTQVPVILSRAAGTAQFDQEWSVSISRAGDYLLQTWLRVHIERVVGNDETDTLRWTNNFMHNLIRECCITFNDLVAARFDNFHLDFWTAFTVPKSKRNGYDNMIGNFQAFSGTGEQSNVIEPAILNLPLPFFYSRDSGVALPTAALPYNEMRISFSFRRWQDLLVCVTGETEELAAEAVMDNTVDPPVEVTPAVPFDPPKMVPGELKVVTVATGPNAGSGTIQRAPRLHSAYVWANYAIVSNDERKRMACAPRDILIEQCQTAPRQTFRIRDNNNAGQQPYDIRFSHAVKALFFAARRKEDASNAEWSNYTNSPVEFETGLLSNTDPIHHTSLIYENTHRLSQMGSDYFSLVQPFYHADVIPEQSGYHMYSYALHIENLDPTGSTNYGKLTNVTIAPRAWGPEMTEPEPIYVEDANDPDFGSQQVDADGNPMFTEPQVVPRTYSYEFIVTAVNNNIIRVSGGALGFPVL